MYSPKRQSSSSENEKYDDVPIHPSSIETTAEPTKGQASEGSRQRNHLSNSHESMYRATVEGDLVAAEMLLEEYPSLSIDEISEDGDRALHMAAAMKHQELVEKLLKRMSPDDLTLLDGHGYTCCYAGIAGTVEIANLMMEKNATLATARDRENKTPLYKAAFRRNERLVSYFLESVRVDDLPAEEWFDLLSVSIRLQMYDVALEISRKNEQVATMRNDEGTALHLLARQQRFYQNHWHWRFGTMRRNARMLAENLWGIIQRSGQDRALDLIQNPSVLHAAAEKGNVELITMITHTYPHLVWHTDRKGYTIFHIAVKYRKENLFALIDEIGARVDSIAVTQDENGNNMLHLAAGLGVLDKRLSRFPTFHSQMEIKWFQKTWEIVPPVCSEMRNKDGHTPYELFSKEHQSLIEKNVTWTKNSSDSWMLISTLIFSVVFASAFAVPGGYDQTTGIPILYKSAWFTCFVVFEALAMLSSALSVFYFSRTVMGSEEEVLLILPHRMKNGLLFLSFSFSATSAFMSAYFLVYTKYRAALVTSVIMAVYVTLVVYVFHENLFFRLGLTGVWFRKWNRRSLFRRHDGAVGEARLSKLIRILLWIVEKT